VDWLGAEPFRALIAGKVSIVGTRDEFRKRECLKKSLTRSAEYQ
jgi:hypothetical protein